MSMRSSQRSTSGPSSVSARKTAIRAISTAAASWSNPAAMCWMLTDASTQLHVRHTNTSVLLTDRLHVLLTESTHVTRWQWPAHIITQKTSASAPQVIAKTPKALMQDPLNMSLDIIYATQLTVPQHQLSTCVIVGHSQSLAWWLSILCQSTRQTSQDP